MNKNRMRRGGSDERTLYREVQTHQRADLVNSGDRALKAVELTPGDLRTSRRTPQESAAGVVGAAGNQKSSPKAQTVPTARAGGKR